MRVANVGRASTAQVAAMANVAAQFDAPFSPLAWPGRALVALGEGQWLLALLLVGVTLALTVGVFAASLATAERLYITGWARTRAVSAPRRAARALPRRAKQGRNLWPSAFAAIVVKDWKLLTRDLRHYSQLVTPIVFGVIYTFSLVRGTERMTAAPWGREIVTASGLGTALFVAWIFAARLGLGALGLEGKRYWILKVSPLRAEILLAAKFALAYALSLALGIVFLVAATVLGRNALSSLPYSLIALMAALAALCSVYLAFGTAGANLNYEDPRQVTRGTMGCLGWLAGTATMGLVAAIFMGLPMLTVLGVPGWIAQALGLAVGLSLCALAVTLSFVWARGRVARMGED
jgi:hypothetical protein